MRLNGGAGDDTIIAGTGTTTINGGAGADELTASSYGNASQTTFVFNTGDVAAGEKIHLVGLDHGGNTFDITDSYRESARSGKPRYVCRHSL